MSGIGRRHIFLLGEEATPRCSQTGQGVLALWSLIVGHVICGSNDEAVRYYGQQASQTNSDVVVNSKAVKDKRDSCNNEGKCREEKVLVSLDKLDHLVISFS